MTVEESPLVSVVVSVYNHEAYIERCLESIAAQVVSFPMEVIIADDCSTDGTPDVLRNLEAQLPATFTIILRSQNMGAVANGEDLYARATGKYLIDLEGDDFWVDNGKLQRQVDFLESNPDCSAVYTQCVVVGRDSEPNGEKYPECPHEWYTWKDFFYSRLPGQSSTLMSRRDQYITMREELMNMRDYEFYPGDRRNAFLFLVAGNVYCIQQQLTAYRHVTDGGSSYSSTIKFEDAYALNEVGFGRTIVKYAQMKNDNQALRVAKKTFYRTYLKWAFDKRSSITVGDCFHELMAEKAWPLYLLAPLQWYVVLGVRALMGKPVDL